MSSWLIGLIGVIFLGVLLDVIYPNGKTNAFCKSIFGIFAVGILISPLLKLKSIDVNVSNDFVSEQLLMNLNASKENYYKLKLEKILVDESIQGANVEIQGNTEENQFVIENIYIDTSELVLTKNITNINKYEVITNIILEAIEIDKERIIIYG